MSDKYTPARNTERDSLKSSARNGELTHPCSVWRTWASNSDGNIPPRERLFLFVRIFGKPFPAASQNTEEDHVTPRRNSNSCLLVRLLRILFSGLHLKHDPPNSRKFPTALMLKDFVACPLRRGRPVTSRCYPLRSDVQIVDDD